METSVTTQWIISALVVLPYPILCLIVFLRPARGRSIGKRFFVALCLWWIWMFALGGVLAILVGLKLCWKCLT